MRTCARAHTTGVTTLGHTCHAAHRARFLCLCVACCAAFLCQCWDMDRQTLRVWRVFSHPCVVFVLWTYPRARGFHCRVWPALWLACFVGGGTSVWHCLPPSTSLSSSGTGRPAQVTRTCPTHHATHLLVRSTPSPACITTAPSLPSQQACLASYLPLSSLPPLLPPRHFHNNMAWHGARMLAVAAPSPPRHFGCARARLGRMGGLSRACVTWPRAQRSLNAAPTTRTLSSR